MFYLTSYIASYVSRIQFYTTNLNSTFASYHVMHKICVHNKCMTEASFVIIIQQQHAKKRVSKQVSLNFNRLNTFPLLCLTFGDNKYWKQFLSLECYLSSDRSNYDYDLNYTKVIHLSLINFSAVKRTKQLFLY